MRAAHPPSCVYGGVWEGRGPYIYEAFFLAAAYVFQIYMGIFCGYIRRFLKSVENGFCIYPSYIYVFEYFS